MQLALDALTKRYGQFYGRASRSEFWFFILLCAMVNIAADLLDLSLGLNENTLANNFNAIRNGYAITRNSSKFWPFVDWLHDWMVNGKSDLGPGVVYSGVLDLSKYDL